MGNATRRLGLSRETIRQLQDDDSLQARGGQTGSAATCDPLGSCPLSCYNTGCHTSPLTKCVSNLESTCTI